MKDLINKIKTDLAELEALVDASEVKPEVAAEVAPEIVTEVAAETTPEVPAETPVESIENPVEVAPAPAPDQIG